MRAKAFAEVLNRWGRLGRSTTLSETRYASEPLCNVENNFRMQPLVAEEAAR